MIGLSAAGACASRRTRRETSSAYVAGYSASARIASIRAHGVYGSRFSDASDPLAPLGAQLPTAPTITSSVSVSTGAALRAAIANGAEVTITTDITETGRALFDIAAGVHDVRIICTGRTLNITGNYHSYTISPFASRIEIVGGSFNAVPETQGIDVRLLGGTYIGNGLIASLNANGTGTGVCGHRILWERVYAEGYNGLFFVGAYSACQFVGSISGNTLDVTAVSNGALHDGASLYTFGGAAFARWTKIETQLTGTTGGVGTYRVSVSQSRASGSAVSYERPTNCWAINCNLVATTALDNALTENAVRFQGFHLCGVIDSRIWSDAKYCARFHPEYSYGFSSGAGILLNCQLERNGIQAISSGGMYPWVDAVVLDQVKYYGAPGQVTVGGISIPRYGVVNITSISGNGSTITVTTAPAEGHGLTTGDPVSNVAVSIGGYNVTNQNVTVLDYQQFTVPGSGTGSPTGQGSYVGYVRTNKPGVTYAYMSNVELFTAPAYSTNGTGILPDPSPPSSWPTCDTDVHALANGNAYRTYVSTPAWAHYTAMPA